MKKKIISVMVILGAFALTGCSTSADTTAYSEGSGVKVKVVTMPDDTTVDCVIVHSDAISCDWENRS